jgi:integrase
MAAKRAYGQGSVYQRADGRWAASLMIDGRRKYVYEPTRAAAARRLQQLRQIKDQGLAIPDERVTLEHYLTSWLEGPLVRSVRPRTLASYRQITELYLVPTLGHHRLGRLRPHHVDELLNLSLARGLSGRTVQYIHAVLRKALNDAIRYELIQRNVAALVEAPSPESRRAPTLDPGTGRAILDAVRGDRLEALYHVAMLGLRQGELLGLRWVDVDLDAGTLRVEQQVQRVAGKLQFSPPKTAGSRRLIPIPAIIIQALREHRTRQLTERLMAGSKWRDHGLIFPSSVGTPMEGPSVTHSFQRALEHHQLPRLRFHDLRHAGATMLRARGVDLKTIQQILGHSSYHVTADVYSHVFAEELRAATDTLGRILSGE